MKKLILMLIAFLTISVSMQAQERPIASETQPSNFVLDKDEVSSNALVADKVQGLTRAEVYEISLKIAEQIVREAQEAKTVKNINWWEVFGSTWTYIIGLLGAFLVYIRIPTKYANIIIRLFTIILNAIFADKKKGGGQHNKIE